MKKCMVLREMLDPRNDQRFLDLRIGVRRPFKVIPRQGTICKLEYSFEENRASLQRLHISQIKKVITMMKVIT